MLADADANDSESELESNSASTSHSASDDSGRFEESATHRLWRAAGSGDVRGVRQALAQGGWASAPAGLLSETPLHAAARADAEAALCLLLAHSSADVEVRDRCGGGALHAAAARGALSCVRLLLARGARLGAAPRSTPRWSALHYAAFNAHAACVRALLLRGDSFDVASALVARDGDGATPYEVADEGDQVLLTLAQYSKNPFAFRLENSAIWPVAIGLAALDLPVLVLLCIEAWLGHTNDERIGYFEPPLAWSIAKLIKHRALEVKIGQ